MALSLFPNNYAAGVQALMEAQSCRRPVVVTATSGLRGYLDAGVTTVPPGDPAALRRAIMHLLDHPAEARSQAEVGHARAMERCGNDRFVRTIAHAMSPS